MGLRSSMVLCAGGVLSNFVLVPLIWMIGGGITDAPVYPGHDADRADERRADLPRLRALHRRRRHRDGRHLRHPQVAARRRGVVLDRGEDVQRRARRRAASAPTSTCRFAQLVRRACWRSRSRSRSSSASLSASPMHIVLGVALTLGFSFFFASVAANAIATTARNPVSGMTMLTIIVSSIVLLRFGVSGQSGMFFVMAIAGHGVHGAVDVGADDHRPEDRLLAGLDAVDAAAGEVPGRDRGGGGGGPDDRDAGAGVPVRRGGAGRRARRCSRRRRRRS